MNKNSLTIPEKAVFIIDKKGNVLSKKIDFVKVPLSNDVALRFIEMLGWDLKKNQPITWN